MVARENASESPRKNKKHQQERQRNHPAARAKCERGTKGGGVLAHGLVGDVEVGDVVAVDVGDVDDVDVGDVSEVAVGKVAVGDVEVGKVAMGSANVFVCEVSGVMVGASCVLCGAEILFCISGAALAGRSMITSLPPRNAASIAIDPRSITMVPSTIGKYSSEAKNILRADALSTRRRKTNA